MDSTKPASRSTRRCLDTIGCGMPSCRSISPTDCCDETSRLRIARRFGSAMISNTDSIRFVYSTEHIRVKVYLGGKEKSASRLRLVGHCWGVSHYRSGDTVNFPPPDFWTGRALVRLVRLSRLWNFCQFG